MPSFLFGRYLSSGYIYSFAVVAPITVHGSFTSTILPLLISLLCLIVLHWLISVITLVYVGALVLSLASPFSGCGGHFSRVPAIMRAHF